VSEHKDRLLDELTELDKFIEISESIVKLTEERESLNRVITDMVITKDKCQYYLSSMPQLEKAIAVSSKTIAEIEENITLARFKALEYENLLNERTLLEEKFDEMEILRETLSSTKGLPLLFMKLYMEDIKVRVNDLLAVVYDGDLEIDDFKIDDKEFNIPYTKRGMTVSDIRICSQGERSFISVALSFALMKQSVDKYNVLLLDEIDATLDMRNRRLFIDILERQLDMINARQCFMITHNDMFDNHPVSIIYTNKKEEGSNIIQIR
jgi:DNA repair exonuclease SbcCD ATPase subunit